MRGSISTNGRKIDCLRTNIDVNVRQISENQMNMLYKFSSGREMERERFMRLALKEAQSALADGEVPVGCILTVNGTVKASGHNRCNEQRCSSISLGRAIYFGDTRSSRNIE